VGMKLGGFVGDNGLFVSIRWDLMYIMGLMYSTPSFTQRSLASASKGQEVAGGCF